MQGEKLRLEMVERFAELGQFQVGTVDFRAGDLGDFQGLFEEGADVLEVGQDPSASS